MKILASFEPANAGGARIQLGIVARPSRRAPFVERELLQLAREAVTNAITHAQSTVITIELSETDDGLLLVVRDDGRGFEFDLTQLAAAGHFGILGMKERMRRLDGTVVVNAGAGQGTIVQARVPFTRARAGSPK